MLLPLYQYRAEVVSVNKDGSLSMDFDLGFEVSHKEGSAWIVGTETASDPEHIQQLVEAEKAQFEGNNYLVETSFSHGRLLVELFWESAGVMMLASEVLQRTIGVVA